MRILNPDIKVIASSGAGSNGEMARALGAGVNHFVTKPYTAEQILRVLYQIIHEG